MPTLTDNNGCSESGVIPSGVLSGKRAWRRNPRNFSNNSVWCKTIIIEIMTASYLTKLSTEKTRNTCWFCRYIRHICPAMHCCENPLLGSLNCHDVSVSRKYWSHNLGKKTLWIHCIYDWMENSTFDWIYLNTTNFPHKFTDESS